MKPVERTPSVHFIFDDESSTLSHNIKEKRQTDIKYQFSQTNQKEQYLSLTNIDNISLNLNKILAFTTPPSFQPLKTEQFYQEFESKYVVNFESQDTQQPLQQDLLKNILPQNLQESPKTSEQTEQIFKQVRLSLPETKRESINLNLSINNIENLNFNISDLCSKQYLSSDNHILKNNTDKLPQIIHSDKIIHKKTHLQTKLHLPQIHHSKKCQIYNSNLYFTSKATPRDYNYAKKAFHKFCLKVQPISQHSIFQSKTSLSNNNKIIKKDRKACLHQLTSSLTLQKNHLFHKLPSLR